MTIAAIRNVIEFAQYVNLDLQGHTREEFARRDVSAVVTPHIEALQALVIAPRFARDIERRDTVLANCKRRIERWNDMREAEAEAAGQRWADANEGYPQGGRYF